MELAPQFREFMSNVRPSTKQVENWKQGSATLRGRLNADTDLKDSIVSTFLQGSIRRSTAIRPLGEKRPDVDIVVVTDINYERTTPQAAMDKFLPFLEKYYAGKWRPQGRSFGIELSYVDLDLVITALPTDPRSRSLMEKLYRSQSVQTSSTLEDRADWRLNENWKDIADVGILGTAFGGPAALLEDAPQSDWKPHPLMLPDRDLGEWGRTHPLAQIQWTAAKNRRCNSHYINIVRALKWWRQEHSLDLPKYPKGYPLEHLIGHVLTDGTTSMASGIVDVLEAIRDSFRINVLMGTVPVLCDHGVPEHNVFKRLTARDFAAFHAAVSDAAATAREALLSNDAAECGKLWRSLFGSQFPLPSPQGGDRGRGFTAPLAPAQPTSERFA